MIEKTNLDMCKQVAKDFLHIDIDESSRFAPAIVSHPFFQSAFIYDDNSAELLNIIESEENLTIAYKQKEQLIDNVEDYFEFSVLLTKPYRLAFLKHTMEYTDIQDFSKYLICAWIGDDYSNRNTNVTKSELLEFFKRASKQYLMDPEEFEIYSKLDDVVTVYRGVTDYNKDNIQALSWTLDKEKAQWFANRFEQNGGVYQAHINKKDIFAYCDQRGEKEIILDYTKLYDLELIEE